MMARLKMRHWAAIAAIVMASLTPFVAEEYRVLIMTQCLIFAIAAIGLDLVWGYTGILNIGHTLWFGMGALTVGVMTTEVSSTGMVTQVGGEWWLYVGAVLVSLVIALVSAMVIGWYALGAKVSHFYVAVVGLALTMTATHLYTQFPAWTGGENGLFGFGFSELPTTGWYFVVCAVFFAVLGALGVLVRSDFGVLLKAIRDNERRARYLGFNVERVKVAVFCLGSAVAALAGALYACVVGAVSAPLFGFLFATELLVWVAVGGRGTLVGPALAAVILTLAGSELNRSFPAAWGLVISLGFIVVVMFLPSGLLPWLGRLTGIRVMASPHRPFSASDQRLTTKVSESQRDLLDIQALHFGYGKLRVLKGLNLQIRTRELLCIIGPNGAGKSSLIEAVTDGSHAKAGRVTFLSDESVALDKKRAHVIARHGVIRKFQIPSLFPSLTVSEHLLLASLRGRLPSVWKQSTRVEVRPSVATVCKATGLEGRDGELASQLAHGLKQGLEIAMSVCADAPVILMDEPTAGLSANEREAVGKILRALVDAGRSVVLIEHDIDFVMAIADRLAVLHDGQVLREGRPEDVVNAPEVRTAYMGTVAGLAPEGRAGGH